MGGRGSALRREIPNLLLAGRSHIAICLGAMHHRIRHPFCTVPAFIALPPTFRLQIGFIVGREALNLRLGEIRLKIILVLGRGAHTFRGNNKLLAAEPPACIDDNVTKIAGGMIENNIVDLAQPFIIHAVKVGSADIFAGLADRISFQSAKMCRFSSYEFRRMAFKNVNFDASIWPNSQASIGVQMDRNNRRFTVAIERSSPNSEGKLNLAGIFRVRFAYWNIGILGRINRIPNRRRGRFGGNAEFVLGQNGTSRRHWYQMPESTGTDTKL